MHQCRICNLTIATRSAVLLRLVIKVWSFVCQSLFFKLSKAYLFDCQKISKFVLVVRCLLDLKSVIFLYSFGTYCESYFWCRVGSTKLLCNNSNVKRIQLWRVLLLKIICVTGLNNIQWNIYCIYFGCHCGSTNFKKIVVERY